MENGGRHGRPAAALASVAVRQLARVAGACLLLANAVGAQDYPTSPGEYLRRMDSNGDGRISEAEYVTYLSRGFLAMDRNGDGILESSELPGGRGKPISLREFQGNIRRQFHQLDRNHDGYLSAKELSQPPG